MSTRFYPRFVKGNPQLRIFLPDWKMVMIKPKHKAPDTEVSFKIDPRMTDWDVKNYLEKIYKVPVAAVSSRILAGEITRSPEGIEKGSDYKIARVSLGLGHSFKWPELFSDEKFKETLADSKRIQKELSEGREKDPNVQDVPSWFA